MEFATTAAKWLPAAASIYSASRKPKAPGAPKAPPTADEDALKRARKRSMAAQQSRSGRASTYLSDRETLG
jgi:hypothetical protein